MESNITLNRGQEETWQIEQFVEQIADQYNIFNSYYSNILVSLVESVYVVGQEEAVNISFWSEKSGLYFFIEGGFSKVGTDDDFTFLISKLSDHYKVSNEGLTLRFSINSINKELSAHRKDAYFNYLNGMEVKTNDEDRQKNEF
ncbi:MAG: hypothetical protein ACQESZ_06180 [Bacteroidota bacterium]